MNSAHKKTIFNSNVIKHKWLCLASGMGFMLFSMIDIVTANQYFIVLCLLRLIVFSSALLSTSDINKVFFNKYHKQITATLLTIISIINTTCIFTSSTPFVYACIQLLIYSASSTLFIVKPKYFLPIFLIPFVLYATSPLYFSNPESITLFGIFSFSVISFISIFSHIMSYGALNSAVTNFSELKKSKDKILLLHEENSELIRILCHDLGNASSIISISLEMLEKDLYSVKEIPIHRKRNLDRIKRALSTHKEIIDQIRNREALESGKYSIKLEPVSINILFEKVKFIFQDKIKEKNISFVFNFSDEKSPFLCAELVSLSNHVINNIVSNAIKFSHKDSQIVFTTWNDKDSVYITIEDFGIGMTQQMTRDIFKSNIKTSRKGTNGEKGTGFGIPLVKSYMEKYGGDVFVDSRENCGTRFILKFKTINALEMDNERVAS